MSRIILAAIVLYSVIMGVACDKTKTLNDVDRLSTQFRIYGRNIAKTNNDAFVAGGITKDLHSRMNTAVEMYLKALDLVDQGVVAAKGATGDELKGNIDFLKRLMDEKVFGAFLDIVDTVAAVPPELKAKLEAIVSAIRLLFASVTGIFAEAQGLTPEGGRYV